VTHESSRIIGISAYFANIAAIFCFFFVLHCEWCLTHFEWWTVLDLNQFNHVYSSISWLKRKESTIVDTVEATDLYKVPDAVPPIHAVSSPVATDKDPSKFRSIFSDNLQPVATRGKKARGMLLVDIGCSSKHTPLSVSYYN